MDKQLEQRVRERAYELWIQHGSQQGRADEYWYQAEREILAEQSTQPDNENHPAVGIEEVGSLGTNSTSLDVSEAAPVETSSAPLGMTSQTLDEVLETPAAPKTRRRRSATSEVTGTAGEATVAPRRRRSTKTTT